MATEPPATSPDRPELRASGPDLSLGHAALVAGTGLLLMAVVAVGSLLSIGAFVESGNAAATAENVANDETQFRLALGGILTIVLLDVVVAWALYVFLRPVNRSLSLLAMLFRLVYAAIFGVALGNLLAIPALVERSESAGAAQSQQLQELALLQFETFEAIWGLGLAIFGFHLVVVGYLAYDAKYVPSPVGALVALAGTGYVVDGVGAAAMEGYSLELSAFLFVGEIVLLVWLLYRGRTIERSNQDAGVESAQPTTGPDED